MTRRTTARTLTALLLATAMNWSVGGPATASPAPGITEERTGYADATLDGVDRRTGVTVHGVFSVYDPEDQAPFGRIDFFIGDDSGIAYECVTEDSTRATLDRLSSASTGGVLRMVCHSPAGTRSGYAVVGLSWRGEGDVVRHRFDRGECTEHLRVRHADVRGGVLLVVPGVAVATVRPHDHPVDELRQQRIVCG